MEKWDNFSTQILERRNVKFSKDFSSITV